MVVFFFFFFSILTFDEHKSLVVNERAERGNKSIVVALHSYWHPKATLGTGKDDDNALQEGEMSLWDLSQLLWLW